MPRSTSLSTLRGLPLFFSARSRNFSVLLLSFASFLIIFPGNPLDTDSDVPRHCNISAGRSSINSRASLILFYHPFHRRLPCHGYPSSSWTPSPRFFSQCLTIILRHTRDLLSASTWPSPIYSRASSSRHPHPFVHSCLLLVSYVPHYH